MKSDVNKHNMSLLNWLLFYYHCKKGSLQLHFQPSTNHSAVSIFWHWMFTVAPEAISLLCMCDTYCRTNSKATLDLKYWRVFTVLKWHHTIFLLKITFLFHFLFMLLTQSTSLTWYRTVPLIPGCPQCSVNKCWPRLLLGYNYFEPDQFVSALCFHFFRELSHLKHLHWQHDFFLNPPNWSWHINEYRISLEEQSSPLGGQCKSLRWILAAFPVCSSHSWLSASLSPPHLTQQWLMCPNSTWLQRSRGGC